MTPAERRAVAAPSCAFGNPCCPCQDGDACHYVALPGSPAMPPPSPADLAAVTRLLKRRRER